MRFIATLILASILSGVSSGCGKAGQASLETPGASPARVLGLARDLEKGRKIKDAIAAYHQIVRHYPGTPEAAKAAGQIKQIQSAALRKAWARQTK
jgi:hypothetical protein